MTLLLVSFIAGILTVLAPCILPLLPVVIGSSINARSKMTPYVVIGSLAFSILLFTYLLKATTALLTIPPATWSYVSGGIIFGFGIVLLFPKLWENLPFVSKGSQEVNKLMGTGYQKKSLWGDVLVGAALGPVFSTCSPTYFVILATVLPASFWVGTGYLLTYLAGLILVLVFIALLGKKLTDRLTLASTSGSLFKKIIGGLFIVVGLFIITGLDKKLETWVLDTGYFDITQFETKLLNQVQRESNDTSEVEEAGAVSQRESVLEIDGIPRHLTRLFPNTSFENANPDLAMALSGGPTRDGIPAIDNPTFVTFDQTDFVEDIQAIVLQDQDTVKVYPYNILTWHEIVNDTVDGIPVTITFCPLCGSAITYKRETADGTELTFGVSGSLLESNMIMFDRETESLWQQSTGRTLAGALHEQQLELHPMQLLTLGEIRNLYPDALIMSEDTGHNRDYTQNPYAGYNTNNQFVFEPSAIDSTLPAKEIIVAFTNKSGEHIAIPWLALRTKGVHSENINNEMFSFTTNDSGELTITDSTNYVYPFYFEMWFSFAAQHGNTSTLIELE
jgi:cytochrome c biogenesis protein CcdA